MEKNNNHHLRVADDLESLFALPQENEYKKKTIEITPPNFKPLSKIKITPYALKKIELLAKLILKIFKQPLEVYALCIGDNGIINDIIIPKQNVSYASIFIQEDYILEVGNQIHSQGINIIGWVHSHADFGVFFSSTDKENQKKILAETSNYLLKDGIRIKYCFGMTVNIHGDQYGIVSTQLPNGEIIDCEASFVIIEKQQSDCLDQSIYKKMQEEIIDSLHQNVSCGSKK